MTVYLFNASLKTRIENNQMVNPAEELQIMSDKYQLTANRVAILNCVC